MRPIPKPAKRLRQNPYKIKGFWRAEERSRASIARHNQFWRAKEVLARQSLVLNQTLSDVDLNPISVMSGYLNFLQSLTDSQQRHKIQRLVASQSRGSVAEEMLKHPTV